MTSRIPNFLIVGAAKSGTTSLYHYLSQHPEVFMSPVKEPDYFGGHHWKLPLHNINGANPDLQIYQDWNDYLTLFAGAANKVVGEASPSTLYYYKSAIPEISKRLGNPKIIILLRDPVHRAYSHYSFLRRDGKENLSFEAALKAEEERKLQNFHYGYYYRSLGNYSLPVASFQKHFTCAIWTFEELKSKGDKVFAEICRFLEIDDSFEPRMQTVHNASGVPKNSRLNNFLRGKNRIRDIVRPAIDFFLDEQRKQEFVEWIHKKNLKPAEPLADSTAAQLADYYKEDSAQLSNLINNDLSSWRSFGR